MNFTNTLYKLMEMTKDTEIFALPAYSSGEHGGPDIGFRRSWYGSKLKDPNVDGAYFMLCAEARYKRSKNRIKSLKDLYETALGDIEIILHADHIGPSCTVNLGTYSIKKMEVAQWDQLLGAPNIGAIKLWISRNG